MFGIDDAVAAGSKLIDDVVTRIWPDATEIEKAKLAQVSTEIQQQYALVLGQIDTNKVEAAHPSVFVAGWRPAIGWVGASGIAYQVLVMPVGNAVCGMFGLAAVFPATDISLLQTMIGGMLGLGVARSWDKSNGTDTKGVK